MIDIAILLACFNRRDKTLACLAALSSQAHGLARLQIYLFDDGSTDGTGAAVQAAYPSAVVLSGDGSFFWNRSMHAAFARALAAGHQNYLWLNDDTFLHPNALVTLLRSAEHAQREWGAAAIVVGAIEDPQTGDLTYGAGQRVNPRWRPFLYRLLAPNGKVQSVDVMNGNCVLIPDGVARRVGNLDPSFEHGMGDTDYSMRARALGLRIALTETYVGTCARNPHAGTYRDSSFGFVARVKAGFSRKGLPPKSWFRLCRRHGGLLWPVHFCWGYVRIAMGRG